MSLHDLLAEQRFLPLVPDFAPGFGARLADLFVGAGITVVEVPLRTPHAIERLAELAADPRLHVAAGSVLLGDDVDRAVGAGAASVVSPGLSVDVVARSRSLGVDSLPGVSTPSDLMTATALGLTTLKLFPAALLGGPSFIAAVAAPFPRLRFVPSGGIDATSAPDYLRLPAVAAVSGSWATSADELLSADEDAVARRLAAVDTSAAGSTA